MDNAAQIISHQQMTISTCTFVRPARAISSSLMSRNPGREGSISGRRPTEFTGQSEPRSVDMIAATSACSTSRRAKCSSSKGALYSSGTSGDSKSMGFRIPAPQAMSGVRVLSGSEGEKCYFVTM